MDLRDAWAWATLAASVGIVAWLGLDAWIISVWAVVLVVAGFLFVVGRLLARELQIAGPVPHTTHRLGWWSGGAAAFVSCTMAAALVRSGAPVRDFWLLGLLMLMAVTSLRLAYARRE